MKRKADTELNSSEIKHHRRDVSYESLPNETLLHILSFCGSKHLARLEAVCKEVRSFVREYAWSAHYIRRVGPLDKSMEARAAYYKYAKSKYKMQIRLLDVHKDKKRTASVRKLLSKKMIYFGIQVSTFSKSDILHAIGMSGDVNHVNYISKWVMPVDIVRVFSVACMNKNWNLADELAKMGYASLHHGSYSTINLESGLGSCGDIDLVTRVASYGLKMGPVVYTAIIHADDGGQFVRQLIYSKFFDPGYLFKGGNTIAHYACKISRPKSVLLLKERGVPFDQVNDRGFTAIDVAIINGPTDTVKCLVDANNLTDGMLSLALKHLKDKVVKYFIQLGTLDIRSDHLDRAIQSVREGSTWGDWATHIVEYIFDELIRRGVKFTSAHVTEICIPPCASVLAKLVNSRVFDKFNEHQINTIFASLIKKKCRETVQLMLQSGYRLTNPQPVLKRHVDRDIQKLFAATQPSLFGECDVKLKGGQHDCTVLVRRMCKTCNRKTCVNCHSYPYDQCFLCFQ
jgi:hypothetical protein